MPEELVRFWLNKENCIVHRDSCTNCMMDKQGKPKSDWVNRDNWWGPYATKGAAIDVGLTVRNEVYECAKGCGPKQVNPA